MKSLDEARIRRLKHEVEKAYRKLHQLEQRLNALCAEWEKRVQLQHSVAEALGDGENSYAFEIAVGATHALCAEELHKAITGSR